MVNFNQVEIKKTIPKGAGQGNDFKTKKIFVGGIPPTVIEGLLYYFSFVGCLLMLYFSLHN